jgi:putative transposase
MAELSRPTAPNALWCADYKGEFMLGNRRYRYPLTITDFASRLQHHYERPAA